MPVSAAIIEREPLVLSPAEAARFLSVSERSPSRLISEGKIEARKHGPRTLVEVALLKAPYAGLPKKTDHAPTCVRPLRSLPRTLARSRQ